MWEVVHTRYTEPHRHYHTLEHVASLLGQIDQLMNKSRNTRELTDNDIAVLKWAAIFHDLIYETCGPSSQNNEQDSAKQWRRFSTEAKLPPPLCTQVAEIIWATASHEVSPSTDSTSPPSEAALMGLFLDLDLSILGSDKPTYDAYARAIRREYAHVRPLDFCRGRMAVLKKLLGGDGGVRIFHSLAFFEKEGQARENMEKEIYALSQEEEEINSLQVKK